MPVKFCEVSNRTWDGAAMAIISKMEEVGVRKGQILSIDAHNNGPNGHAIFSSHYDSDLSDKGDLSIKFHIQNSVYAWDTFYKQAAMQVSSIAPSQLISITGSCNEKGRCVMYVFYYYEDPSQQIQFCESRSEAGWDDAAKNIISKLRSSGAKGGQVISVDAHSNGYGQEAIFSAFWNSSLPDQGELDIEFKNMKSDKSWSPFYRFAANFCSQTRRKIISITSSLDTSNESVTFIFHEKNKCAQN